MGGSSGGSAALIMAWYHPDLYHRVLTYSGTFVNQQWPPNPETPHGAWEFHEHLIPEQPGQADSHLDGGRRPRPAQPERDARRHARLGGGQREHGRRARRQGLSLPVRVRPERGPHRSRREAADAARRRSSGCGRRIPPRARRTTSRSRLGPNQARKDAGTRLLAPLHPGTLAPGTLAPGTVTPSCASNQTAAASGCQAERHDSWLVHGENHGACTRVSALHACHQGAAGAIRQPPSGTPGWRAGKGSPTRSIPTSRSSSPPATASTLRPSVPAAGRTSSIAAGRKVS